MPIRSPAPRALLVLGGMLAVSVFVGLLGARLGVFGQMVIPTVLVVVAVQVNFQAAILPLYAGCRRCSRASPARR